MATTTASALTLEQLDEMMQPLKTAFEEKDAQDTPLATDECSIAELASFSMQCTSLAASLSILAHNTLREIHQRA